MDSTCKCNFSFEEYLIRRAVAERFARSMVKSLCDSRYRSVRQLRKISPLREVLPHQPVSVFIEAPLPRTVRMSKVELSVELSRHPLMTAELPAIVAGNGVDAIRDRAQQYETSGSDLVGRIGCYLF